MECGFVYTNGSLKPINDVMAQEIASEFVEGQFVSGELKIAKPNRIRTINQNSAMHQWFKMIAIKANDCGLDIRALMSQQIEIPCTPHNIKETVWRPVQEVLTGKESSTKLDRKEVSEIAQTIDRYLLTKNGINTPFPSMDSLANESQE